MNELETLKEKLMEVRAGIRGYRQRNDQCAKDWMSLSLTGQARIDADRRAAYYEGYAAGLEHANFQYLEIIEMIDEILYSEEEEKK